MTDKLTVTSDIELEVPKVVNHISIKGANQATIPLRELPDETLEALGKAYGERLKVRKEEQQREHKMQEEQANAMRGCVT